MLSQRSDARTDALKPLRYPIYRDDVTPDDLATRRGGGRWRWRQRCPLPYCARELGAKAEEEEDGMAEIKVDEPLIGDVKSDASD